MITVPKPDKRPHMWDELDNMVFVDLNRACELYGTTRRSLLQRVHDHGLKVHQLGRKFFFIAKDFKKLMEDYPIGSNTSRPR